MAAPSKTHAPDLEVEIIVGSYEQVLFGYNLTNSDDSATLDLSFTDKSHCASIRALAVSNKKLLASGSADETIQLFDLKTRHEAGTLMKHSGTITHIEFYDEFMFSSDDAGLICIWRISGRSFECLKTLTGHKGSVLSMSVHPSGKMLLSVGHDKTIRTWNLISAKRAYTTSVHALVDVIKWSPNGEKYVLAHSGKLEICNLSKAAPIHSIKLPGKAHSLDFLNRNLLSFGCEGGTLMVINIDTAETVLEKKMDCNRIKCVCVRPLDESESMLSLITNDGLIELYLAVVKDDSVRLNLISATRTALRPVCMDMSVVTAAPSDVVTPNKQVKGGSKLMDKTSAAESQAAQTESRKKKRKAEAKTGRERLEKSAKTDIQSANKEETKVEKKVGFTEPEPQAEPQAEPQLRKRKSTVRRRMDSIKKFISPKSKPKDEEGTTTKKAKKHMKPVDSVKIAKQKMNLKKNAARHHHISEGDSRSSVIEEEQS